MNYYFNVSDLILTCTNTRRTIVSDSVNLHVAKFTFDSMWNGVGKTATFTNSKTGISVNKVIDLDQCLIPWEVLEATKEGGYLEVCVTGVSSTTSFPTKMDMNYPLVIGLNSPNTGLPPADPTQSVYDQIMTEFANRYVDAIYEHKTIPMSDWQAVTDIFTITTNFTPTIITSTTVTMRTANLTDYLDRVSYPYGDFYLDYSANGTTTTRVVATSESGTSPNLRRINFTIVGNVYEVRITSTKITIRRMSGSTAYYIHTLLLRFDDYYTYQYTVDGLTTYYKSNIFVENNSKQLLRPISFNQFPTVSNGYIQLNFSQIPQGDVVTKFFGFKTDENAECAEWCNIYGDAVFEDVSDEPISDLDTTNDNKLATIGQIKEYINSKIV